MIIVPHLIGFFEDFKPSVILMTFYQFLRFQQSEKQIQFVCMDLFSFCCHVTQAATGKELKTFKSGKDIKLKKNWISKPEEKAVCCDVVLHLTVCVILAFLFTVMNSDCNMRYTVAQTQQVSVLHNNLSFPHILLLVL